LEVRRSLEELAIELACRRMPLKAIEELEIRQEEFKEAIEKGNAMEIAKTDEAYHDVIYKGTCNARLVQMINNLREQMYRYRLEYIKDEDKRQILLLEHDNILKAVRQRKIQEAKKAMREHIDNQEITVSKNIKEQE
jgi:DNA-binding GntR family transcriptional regulator